MKDEYGFSLIAFYMGAFLGMIGFMGYLIWILE